VRVHIAFEVAMWLGVTNCSLTSVVPELEVILQITCFTIRKSENALSSFEGFRQVNSDASWCGGAVHLTLSLGVISRVRFSEIVVLVVVCVLAHAFKLSPFMGGVDVALPVPVLLSVVYWSDSGIVPELEIAVQRDCLAFRHSQYALSSPFSRGQVDGHATWGSHTVGLALCLRLISATWLSKIVILSVH